MKSLFIAIFLISGMASAKEIVRGAPAQNLYDGLVQVQQATPDAVTYYTNMFFGDDIHPERGRLWFTTIFRNDDTSVKCYQYDYREAGMIDYMCELTGPNR